MDIQTFNDVHLAFADKGAPYKQDVAKAMRMTPAVFSHVIADRDGTPSQEWVARFEDAWQVCINGVPTS